MQIVYFIITTILYPALVALASCLGQIRPRRVKIPDLSVPRFFFDALLIGEDRRFYSHYGIDWFTFPTRPFRRKLPGSTLTQQLVKNMYFDQSKWGRNKIRRKIVEAPCAILLERMYSKSEILNLYAAYVWWGNTKGLPSAAQVYFETEYSQLTPVQLIALATALMGPKYCLGSKKRWVQWQYKRCDLLGIPRRAVLVKG